MTIEHLVFWIRTVRFQKKAAGSTGMSQVLKITKGPDEKKKYNVLGINPTLLDFSRNLTLRWQSDFSSHKMKGRFFSEVSSHQL